MSAYTHIFYVSFTVAFCLLWSWHAHSFWAVNTSLAVADLEIPEGGIHEKEMCVNFAEILGHAPFCELVGYYIAGEPDLQILTVF